jgi:hypothetical protein
VCQIAIDGYGEREFPSDFFKFDDENIQMTWETEEIEYGDLQD